MGSEIDKRIHQYIFENFALELWDKQAVCGLWEISHENVAFAQAQ